MSGEAAEDIARRILEQLGQAWNAGNGGAFGQPFAADADFVAIRGEYHHSRDAISRGHQALFDTIYTGSTVTYSLLQARALTESVILVHAQGQLQAPGGRWPVNTPPRSRSSWCVPIRMPTGGSRASTTRWWRRRDCPGRRRFGRRRIKDAVMRAGFSYLHPRRLRHCIPRPASENRSCSGCRHLL